MKMFRVVVNGSEYKVGIEELTDERTVQPMPARPAPPAQAAQPRPEPAPAPTLIAAAAPAPPAGNNGAGTTIVAPIPGTVLRVSVAVGDTVSKGQTLLVLEAMKMENEIMAPSDGVVQLLQVSPGVSVKTGETLAVLSR